VAGTATGQLIVVDAANVIGSRPDGWWRDRAGAVQRLLAQLAASDLAEHADAIVVVEGRARDGAPPGTVGAVRVVHAGGDGDNEIVAVVEAARTSVREPEVTVVTADRELRARVLALGAGAEGPRWLLDRVERDDRRG
jgi:hypothetical protein